MTRIILMTKNYEEILKNKINKMGIVDKPLKISMVLKYDNNYTHI